MAEVNEKFVFIYFYNLKISTIMRSMFKICPFE